MLRARHHVDARAREDGLEELRVLRADDSVALALEYPHRALQASARHQVYERKPQVRLSQVDESASEVLLAVGHVGVRLALGNPEEALALRHLEAHLERGEAALGHPVPVRRLHHARRRRDEDESADLLGVLQREPQRAASAHGPSDEHRAVRRRLERALRFAVELLDGGNTVPFIARYRKEVTGALDEVQVASVSDQLEKLNELAKRKETILKTIEEQGKLTSELKTRIEASWDSTELEDIYLPFKPKRKTRAEVARQKGLEPLATFLLMQNPSADVDKKAKEFVSKEKGVASVEEAIQGAQDIIAEKVSESEEARNIVRFNFKKDAVITSVKVKPKTKNKEEEEEWEQKAQKYRDYFDFSEKLAKCASHRLLAMRRGEAEGILRVSISGDDERCLDRLDRQFLRNSSKSAELVWNAIEDGFKRLLKPSIETEFANISKERADQEAIRIFVKNLEQLLMSPPLGQKRVLALDPGFRTGCKVVCLDAEGNLLHTKLSPSAMEQPAVKLKSLCVVWDCLKRFRYLW